VTVDFAFFAVTALAVLAILWATIRACEVIGAQVDRVHDWCER
jgi:hypothetical protein